MSPDPRTDFRPLRPIKEWDRLNPHAFDPRASVFIPDRAVVDSKIQSVSPRKVQLIGAKIYNAAAANSIANTVEATVDFDTVSFCEGMTAPTGATFTTLVIPYNGIYLLNTNIEWVADDKKRNVWFYINGAKGPGDGRSNDNDSFATKHSLTSVQKLTAGDTVAVRVLQSNTGANTRALAKGEDSCSLSVIFQGAI